MPTRCRWRWVCCRLDGCDRIGARTSLLGGLWVFLAASTLGAWANSWDVVLVARAGQGTAAAVMLPAGLAALTLCWAEPAAKAHALGVWSGVSAIATALGPAVGGLLVQLVGWRAVFWVNVPLVLVALVGTRQQLDDVRGSGRQSGRPASPWQLLASLLAAFMMTSGANGMLQVVTVRLQAGMGFSAGRAGSVLLLATVPFVVLGPVSGRLVVRWGRRVCAACGFALGGLGLLAMGRAAGMPGLLPGLLGIGIALGLMTAAVVGETMTAWPSRPGVAGGLNNAFRQAGTSVGVAVGGLVAARDTGVDLLRRAGTMAGSWWLLAGLVVTLGFARQRAMGRAHP